MATMAVERGASAGDHGDPERGYPDLHDHIADAAQGGPADRGRSRDQQGHRDASAGALAVPRRHRAGGSPRLPVHQRASTARAASSTFPCWSAGSPATTRSTRSAWAARSRRSATAGCKAMSHPIKPRMVKDAPCQEIVYTGRRSAQRPRPRRHSGADLVARLGQRALHHVEPFHHRRSRHRHPEHGQLPGHDQSAGPHGHEPVDRAAHRRLHALGEVEGEGQADALRGGARLPAGGVLHRRAEGAGDLRRARHHRRADRAAAQRGQVQDGRSHGAGRSRDHHRGLCLHRVPRTRGAVRRIPRPRQSAGIQRRSWTSPRSPGARMPS